MNMNQRIIKFRAWDNEHMVMIDGRSTMLIDSYDGAVYLTGREDFVSWIPLQFTGLKDKNGKEIYEGDIIRHNGTNRLAIDNRECLVEFKDGAFCLTAFHDPPFGNKSVTIRDLMCEAKVWGHTLKLEIIGNMYEHPELLEKK